MRRLLLFIPALLLLASPATASAQILDAINSISSGLLSSFSATTGNFGSVPMTGLAGLAATIYGRVLVIFDTIAVLVIVWEGIRLITSQEENKLTQAKNVIAATVVGLILAQLAPRFVAAFVSWGSLGSAWGSAASATIITEEVGGVIDFVLTLVAVLGVTMIIVSGIRAISAFGKEDGMTNLKQTVFGTITGIFFLIISGAVKQTFGLPTTTTISGSGPSPDPSPIIGRIAGIVDDVLDLLAVLAVAVVIYAGIILVLSLGDQEKASRSRSIILRAVVGLLIVLLSKVAVQFIIDAVA